MNQSSHQRFLVSFALVYIRRQKISMEKEQRTQVKVWSVVALFTSPEMGSGVSVGIMATLKNILQ